MKHMSDFDTGNPRAAAVDPQPLVRSYNGLVYSHRKTKPRPVGICALCEETTLLARSHINPTWAWIRPKMLNGGEQKIQGAQWFYLLCEPCDQLLGYYEAELRSASYLQPDKFNSVLVFREVNIALLGILWKASIAYRMWVKGSFTLDEEVEEWIRSILITLKENREAGLRAASTACHWVGIKFFTKDDINAFETQSAPRLGDGNDYIGMTFLAGIRWEVFRGKGSFAVGAHVWDEGQGLKDEDINVPIDNGTSEKMRELALVTLDSDHCPCGSIVRNGFGEAIDPKPFAKCCKNGWLSKPFIPGYYVVWEPESID